MLIEMLIAMSCQDATLYREACLKSLEAGAKQSGVHQTVQTVEDMSTKAVEKTVVDAVGKDVVAVPALAAKVYRDRAINYGFKPKLLSIDRLDTRINFDGSASMNLRWDF